MENSSVASENSSYGHDGLANGIRLDLSNLPLCGRQNEQKALLKAYNQAIDNSDRDHFTGLVWIHGESGMGKSVLVTKTLFTDKHRLLGTGKLIKGASSRPFAAIADALDHLLEQSLKSSDSARDIVESLREALGDEADVVAEVVPSLEDALDLSMGAMSLSFGDEKNSSTFDRLKYLIKQYISAISKHRSVVIFIDDVQWIDPPSLEMFHYLAKSKMKNTLLIGAYRDEEIDRYHVLLPTLQAFRETAAADIKLYKIKEDDVNQLLAHILEMRPEGTKELSKLVYKKTGGNAFFVVQFVASLQEEQLLTFSLQSYRWTWNIREIRDQMSISSNLLQIVTRRIGRLLPQAQVMLKMLSCLGSFFRIETVQKILDSVVNENEEAARLFEASFKSSEASQLLEPLVQHGIIEQIEDCWYKFSHDKVYESVYQSLDRGKQRDSFHLQVGQILHEMRRENHSGHKDDDWLLFATVDQMNKGAYFLQDPSDRVRLAEMNLEAGKRAQMMSAFLPCSEYCTKGFRLLDSPTKWVDNYNLSLALGNLAARTLHSAGKTSQCLELVDELLEHVTDPVDQATARYIDMDVCGTQGDLKGAVEKGLLAAKLLGYKIPLKPYLVQVVQSIMSTRALIKKMTDEEILALPVIQDKAFLQQMKVMTSSMAYAYYGGQKNVVAMLTTLVVKVSLKTGLNIFTSQCACMVGAISLSMGEFDLAYRIGNLALQIAEKTRAKSQLSVTLFGAHFFCIHFRKPIQTSMEQFLKGYRIGMRHGETTDAATNILGYSLYYYFCGFHLEYIRVDLEKFLAEMEEYRQDTEKFLLLPLYSKVLKLLEEPTYDFHDLFRFDNGLMDDDCFLIRAKHEKNMVALESYYNCKADLAYMFGRYKEGADLLAEYDSLHKKPDEMPTFVFIREMFFRGLIYLAMARESWKYKAKAKKIITLMKKWVKGGNINCVDMLALLLAENQSLKKSANVEETIDLYHKAVFSASRTGFVQIEAVAAECAGRYCKSVGDNYAHLSNQFLERSGECYTRWGAASKVKDMETQSLFLRSSELQSSGDLGVGVRARSRFTGMSSKRHRSLALKKY